ncbi:MAG: hypothetical protein K8T91_26945 [Planctomycetes bacterium]|nr:hypothetical protein [Planctomycetota bacterium]
MVYRFPPDVEQQIKERLASGRYANEDDVLREALEALKLSDELSHFRLRIAESRAQADRGEKGPLDVDAVMGRVKRRLSEAS